MVNFIVGSDGHLIEHISKHLLCVRSEYFSQMFRGGMSEHNGDTISVPDTTLEVFESSINYLMMHL